MSENTIRRAIEIANVGIRRRFLRGLQLIRDTRTLEELAILLEGGRIGEALVGAERAAGMVVSAITASYLSGASEAIAMMAMNPGTISFDLSNQRAVDFMRSSRLSLVREMVVDQRQVIGRVMAGAIEDGLNPREHARLFRASVGLTDYQAQVVRNYELALRRGDVENALGRELRDARSDRRIRAAFSGRGAPLSQQEIKRLVDRYRQRWINYRAEAIGRTEALRSVHQGAEDMWRQAFDSGDVDPAGVQRTWRTRMDGRQRDSHGSMTDQKRPVGEPFRSGAGHALRYPGDPNAPASETIHCRCVVVTRIL